ncbi:MAG: branched-chain amino acid ABC transporter permease [Burkholderiaceae bacterium]|nr:branched-chain amino acid ABC transporter permease [Burkholderiaceae bacterium]
MNKLQIYLATLIMAGFMLVPVYVSVSGDTYALILFGRILVFALAALGLNLALGFGGMISLGHAMYIGLGAYSVGIMSSLGWHAGWLHLLVTMLVTAVVAGMLGWVALRTRNIAFIMITLAFAQLFYFIFMGLENFGGDDGMTLDVASNFGPLTGNPYAQYLATAVAVVVAALALSRLVESRFGLVLRATMVSERRVNAVGTASLSYRLMAYVISAELCALAGYFLVNLTGFVSPAYMAWTVSGELIVMVLLGGLGTVFGPVVGAAALLLVEEVLKGYTEHWPLVLGPAIVLMVVFLRKGLWGLLGSQKESANATAEAK